MAVAGVVFAVVVELPFAVFGEIAAVDAASLARGVAGDSPYFVPPAAAAAAAAARIAVAVVVAVAAVVTFLLICVPVYVVFGEGKRVGSEE